MELHPVDYAPPAPPLHLSVPLPASAYVFMSASPGWDGDWHPSPCRQIVLCLAGEIEVEASDGEARRFGPGALALGEDTSGTGHRSRVMGEVDAVFAVVQLAD